MNTDWRGRMSHPIFDSTTDALATSLRMRDIRHKVTSSNIANAETPGYKAKVVDFEDTLQRALDLEASREKGVPGPSIQNVQADVYDNPEINVANDNNTVDLEREMANLQENTILYKAALQMINKKLGTLKYAASDGGGR